ncbi:hypothetical protein SESBI_51155 [Sesbania bispinosa]|nr:hypothetical protein SESBI_51155 [Sesbania bispinosa]
MAKVVGGGNKVADTRYNVGTSVFHNSFGVYDEVEGVAREGEVDVGVAFEGRVVREEENVEEEAKSGGAGDLVVGNGVLDDLVELWV